MVFTRGNFGLCTLYDSTHQNLTQLLKCNSKLKLVFTVLEVHIFTFYTWAVITTRKLIIQNPSSQKWKGQHSTYLSAFYLKYQPKLNYRSLKKLHNQSNSRYHLLTQAKQVSLLLELGKLMKPGLLIQKSWLYLHSYYSYSWRI